MFDCVQHGAVMVYSTRQALDDESVVEIQEISDSLPAGGKPMVVLDLTDVPLVTGLAFEALVESRDEYIRRGGNLKFAAPNPLVKEILRMTDLINRFEVYNRVNDAVGTFVR